MKKAIYILAFLLGLWLTGSAQETPPVGLKPVNAQFYISLPDSAIWHLKGSPYGYERLARYKDLANVNPIIPGGAFTSSNIGVGFNPGTNLTIQQFISKVWYAEPVPNASLTPSTITNELTSASTGSSTLTYAYSKNNGNTDFNSAQINGAQVTLNTNGTTGTYNATYPANTTTVFTFTVTTTGGQSRSVTSTVNYSPRRYWGRTAVVAPGSASSADILASLGGGSALSGSRAGTFTVTASGSNRVFFAYPSSLGNLTSISIGGLESINAFTLTVISFTNASGNTQNYNVYTSNNATSGNVTMITN